MADVAKDLRALAEDDMTDIFRRAMALRVKYRVGKETKVPLCRLAVHPLNRGSVYPNGDRVKGFGFDLLNEGFCEDDADLEGVCGRGAQSRTEKLPRGGADAARDVP